MATPIMTATELKERLTPLIEAHEEGAVVFDADGTLWSHDVGCMVFDEAVAQGVFLDEALPSLREEATRHQLEVSGSTANDVARALQNAWYSRNYDERAAAEMQVWAYVGFSEQSFRKLVREALASRGHSRTLHDEVIGLAEWVRSLGRRACIVSASPLWVVQEAARDLGFSDDEVAAGVPNTKTDGQAQRICAGMASPLPYGEDKVSAGRELLGGATWLAALGDSNFDLDMMREAHLGVGIGSKESMLEGLRELEGAVRLELTG